MYKTVQTVISIAMKRGVSHRGPYAAYFLQDTLQVTHLGHVIFEMKNCSSCSISNVRVSIKGSHELKAVNTCLAALGMKEQVLP